MIAAEAMRTRFEIVLADDRDPGALWAAGEEALDEIARVETELSAFRDESALAEINAEAAERPVRVDGVVFRFLLRAGELSAALDGAFDLSVGALVDLWRRRDPSPEELAEAAARVGFARLVCLDAAQSTVTFSTPGVRLDPGAIGKGYALDRAAEILREVGVASALLHGGTSSVCAIGAPPGAAGWGVAIAHPADSKQTLARVLLRDQSLGVSAPHGRVIQRDGKSIGHVVDPRTGEPVAHTALAAVVTASATDADAASTALLVLGAEGMKLVAERLPGASLLVATPGDLGLRVDVIGDAWVPESKTQG